VLKILRPFLALLFLASVVAALAPSAHAWGCKGHQTVALIAEAHLSPHAREAVLKILTSNPIDPTLDRYCKSVPADPMADASTWPDDIRKIRPDTPPWHFIDIPRGAPRGDISQYCPPQEGCVTSALAAQVQVLKDPSSSPRSKADAIRFIIHFVGDLHQPLHAITNNDEGGNCVPVTFFGKAPTESNPGSGSFHPNLHGVWDTDILERMTPNEPPADLAKQLDAKFGAQIRRWESKPSDFVAWAWESHSLAETVVYGRLPHPLPIEKPRPVTACVEQSDPGSYVKVLKIDEDLEQPYQSAAAPVVETQLAKAGARLATLLNSIWP
jgi:hypothetical protein